MASRRISSLVTTVLPRRLIPPFSPPPSSFHRSNKIHTLSKFSPSSPTYLVLHPRSCSTTTLSNDTLTPTHVYVDTDEYFSDLKQAKENFIKKLREEGNPFQVVESSRFGHNIVLQREYGGDMIKIEALFDEDLKDFQVNVVKRDESTLGFECEFSNLENLHNKEEFEIVKVTVVKDGDYDHGNGRNTQYFWDIDEDLQKGFLDYLDKRGIKNNLVAWLRDYRKDVVAYKKMRRENWKKCVGQV